MNSKLSEANIYIKENKHKVVEEYRLNYHVMAPIGWINDPNGFCEYSGEYHLFYQHYPYAAVWGTMHWGHVKSKDLIRWEHVEVALAPDQHYDNEGCFSGSAIEHDGKLYLMYTGVSSDPVIGQKQIQCIAVSSDGSHFEKVNENPVIGSDVLPKDAIPGDFRDPKVWRKDDYFYSIIASRNIDTSGQFLLFKSDNLIEWTYVNSIVRSENKLGKMWECPDLFLLDGKDVLIMSPMGLEKDGDRYWNKQSCIYMVGKLDYENGDYTYHKKDEIDFGLDFYAPQTLIDEKGRRIMIAWMQMWERNQPTSEHGHNWAGAMTLPRELKLVGDKLYQKVVEEIKEYRREEISYSNEVVVGNRTLVGVEGSSIELELEADMKKANVFGLKLFKSGEEETLAFYSKTQGKFVFDRTKSGHTIIGGEEDIKHGVRKVLLNLHENIIKLNIFIDRCSLEIFINDGEFAMSSTVYPKSKNYGIEFFSDAEVEIKKLTKWKIEIT